MNHKISYDEFLKKKIKLSTIQGFEVEESEFVEINTGYKKLKPHQKDSIMWAAKGGRRALFASFGLGKTCEQLGIMILIAKRFEGKTLIILPLGVKQEFHRDAKDFYNVELQYVKTQEEVEKSECRYLITNYERVRDGDINPNYFLAVSLDEAAILRGYGTKTYQKFLSLFNDVKFKFVATATPSPNKYKEIIHYAGFLGIMDTGQSLTRFFKRDSTKANNLTLHPHKEAEFWLWVSSWALFITSPADLGYDATGYELPELDIRYHEIKVDHSTAGCERDGQMKMFREASLSLKDAATEKRDSIPARIEKLKEILTESPEDHFILWHDLEAERHAIQKAIPEAVSVYGSLDLDIREQRTIDFSDGKIKYFSSKPEISGAGCNFQRHCHRSVFLGIGYKFYDFIQAVHRVHRFGQDKPVRIDVIYTESEAEILKVLLKKWEQHKYLVEKMIEIIREFDLSHKAMETQLKRSFFNRRVEVKKDRFIAINADNVPVTAAMKDNSVDLIHTSIPFANHYEYTPTFNDFGHTTDNDEFFEQMDYLTPELLRVLKPGRVAAIHVKDRILFGNATGDGMPTVDPFSDLTVFHFLKHGFRYMGRIIVLTDVVRENNQTYRLGWTEQCKDGTKMGVGCPEYILLFRKLPTDTGTAYADQPVTKSKEDYPRSRWQLDAHAFWRCSGDRLLTSDELKKTPVSNLQAVYREQSRKTIYDFKEHESLSKHLDENGKLPASFMVVAPGSWSGYVWDDINRMLTLNSRQSQKNLTMHICLAKGSLVLTKERGYVPIQDLKVGEHTFTHMGRWRKILAVKMTSKSAEVVRVKAQGVPGLVLTPTHKVWCREAKRTRAKEGAAYNAPEWVEAVKTVGSYLNFKCPESEGTHRGSLLDWWIVGRWLADGHKGVRKDYYISCGSHEFLDLKKKLGRFAGAVQEHSSASQIRLLLKNEVLKQILDTCGKGALTKQLPAEAYTLPDEYAKALLDGYLSGDGHHHAERSRWMGSSINKGLLLGMSALAQRVYKTIPSVYAGRPERKAVIEGRIVDCKQDWIFSFDLPTERRKKPFILGDGAWKKVRSVEDFGVAETWNIRVEEDESYTAEGCIVKNCPLQFDIVDRVIERFSTKDEVVYDPFAGIMTVPYRAVKLGRKGIGCELNEISFIDGVDYLHAAEEAYNVPTLFDMLEPENAE